MFNNGQIEQRSYSSTGAVFFNHIPTSLSSTIFDGDYEPLSNSCSVRKLELDVEKIENYEQILFLHSNHSFGSVFDFDVNEMTGVMRKLLEKNHDAGYKCGVLNSGALSLLHTIEKIQPQVRIYYVQQWSDRATILRDSFQIQETQPLTPIQFGPKIVGRFSGSNQINTKRPQSELSDSDSFNVDDDAMMDERLRTQIMSNAEFQLLILLLAMVGVVFPQDLTPNIARLVTEALVEAVSLPNSAKSASSSTGSNPQVVATFIQQIRKVGSNIDAKPVSTSNEPIAVNPAFAAELLAKGFPLFRPHINNMPNFIKRLLILTNESEDFPQRATAAERVLSEIGSAHSVMFIKTIGVEVCKREAADSYRRKGLEVLINLVKKLPLAFLRHLPLLAEVVIKTLDPSDPVLRQSCLTASTKALHELVKRYPMISLCVYIFASHSIILLTVYC